MFPLVAMYDIVFLIDDDDVWSLFSSLNKNEKEGVNFILYCFKKMNSKILNVEFNSGNFLEINKKYYYLLKLKNIFYIFFRRILFIKNYKKYYKALIAKKINLFFLKDYLLRKLLLEIIFNYRINFKIRLLFSQIFYYFKYIYEEDSEKEEGV